MRISHPVWYLTSSSCYDPKMKNRSQHNPINDNCERAAVVYWIRLTLMKQRGILIFQVPGKSKRARQFPVSRSYVTGIIQTTRVGHSVPRNLEIVGKIRNLNNDSSNPDIQFSTALLIASRTLSTALSCIPLKVTPHHTTPDPEQLPFWSVYITFILSSRLESGRTVVVEWVSIVGRGFLLTLSECWTFMTGHTWQVDR